jgi:hypothetical protein
MFMPCPFNLVSTRFHDLRQSIHFLAGEALIVREANRGSARTSRGSRPCARAHESVPEVAFVGKEEKTIASNWKMVGMAGC